METSQGAFDYARLGLDEDEFKVIASAALEAGIGVRGPTGEGQSHLFPAPELTRFGVAWLEERFG
jgi:aminoglycoside 3-N-acetyltransferase